MVDDDARPDIRADLFGTVFVLVQNLSRRVDLALAPIGLTSRQWLLLAVIQRHFADRAPSLTEAAAAYGSSRQNVKRIAVQLARRGYLRLVCDPTDRRPTRLVLTDKATGLGGETSEGEPAFLSESMVGLDDAQSERLRDLVLVWLAALGATRPESPDEGDEGGCDEGGGDDGGDDEARQRVVASPSRTVTGRTPEAATALI